MDELSKDFDTAIAKLDTEVCEIAAKVNFEFSLLIQRLSYELDHMSITINVDSINLSEHLSGATSLTAAVTNAGLLDS